jgi:hypothetical protein
LSNLRLMPALAGRMGLTDAVFRMTPPEILKELFRSGGIAVNPATLLDGARVAIATKIGQRFHTKSAKTGFFSHALADQGLPPMPDWQPEPAGAAA